MTHRGSQDWDVCWSYLTKTGCRDPNCTWKHGKSVNQLNPKQNYGRKLRATAAAFYPTKNLQEGWVGDKHGLVQCPDTDDKNRMNFFNRAENAVDFDGNDSISSAMSVSSSEKDLTPSFISTLMNSSPVGSDFEDDVVKTGVNFPKKKETYSFSKGVLLEFLTQKKLKMKLHPDEQSANALSPFSKVFKLPSNESVKERTMANLPSSTLKQFLTPTKSLKKKLYPDEVSSVLSPFAKAFVPMANIEPLKKTSTTIEKETVTKTPLISTLKQATLKSNEFFAYE